MLREAIADGQEPSTSRDIMSRMSLCRGMVIAWKQSRARVGSLATSLLMSYEALEEL